VDRVGRLQVEVDDYRDYEKALEALTEAASILNKLPAAAAPQAAVSELRIRMTLIEAYLNAVRYAAFAARRRSFIVHILFIIIYCKRNECSTEKYNTLKYNTITKVIPHNFLYVSSETLQRHNIILPSKFKPFILNHS